MRQPAVRHPARDSPLIIVDTPQVRRARSPFLALGGVLAFEYWLLSAIPASILDDSRIAGAFVQAMSSLTPLIHRFDRVAAEPQVLSFLLALSPFLLVPKVALVVRWLESDKLRIFRYFVISPTATNVPKGPLAFVTDPLRTNTENRAPEALQPISRARAIGLSLAILLLAFLLGIFWPLYIYGSDFVQGRGGDFRELWVTQGGWRLWLSWSVYQMGLSALFLAMGYAVLREYVRWGRGLFSGLGRARSN